jgi:DNA-binding Xre family transcriptional regulator
MPIAWKLRTLMAENDVKGVDLARLVGLSEESVSRMRRRDDMPAISGESLSELLDALNHLRRGEAEISLNDLVQYERKEL